VVPRRRLSRASAPVCRAHRGDITALLRGRGQPVNHLSQTTRLAARAEPPAGRLATFDGPTQRLRPAAKRRAPDQAAAHAPRAVGPPTAAFPPEQHVPFTPRGGLCPCGFFPGG